LHIPGGGRGGGWPAAKAARPAVRSARPAAEAGRSVRRRRACRHGRWRDPVFPPQHAGESHPRRDHAQWWRSARRPGRRSEVTRFKLGVRRFSAALFRRFVSLFQKAAAKRRTPKKSEPTVSRQYCLARQYSLALPVLLPTSASAAAFERPEPAAKIPVLLRSEERRVGKTGGASNARV